LPEIDRGFGALDPVIVSGFAYGVDIVAHQMAMDHNLQTIVVAHGLNQIYPKTHKICRQSGRKRWFYYRVLEHFESG
jgi:predicted Rossmann fold nucleotide-binding protein DprA/Smf involved in DNA uptake